jgi:hypothetical protein
VRIPEPDTLDELIADCAEIPDALCTCHLRDLPEPAARPWQVDEACLAQVRDFDAFV